MTKYNLTADQERAIIADAVKAGEAAASWVFDGNTSRETYAAFLEMSENGDPALYDAYAPTSSLSGEWADSPTVRTLLEDYTDLMSDDDLMSDENEGVYADLEDEVYQLYDNAYQDAYWTELERVALGQA